MPDRSEFYTLLGRKKMPKFVQEYDQVDRQTTGSLALDYCFGGGLPRGRAIEVGGLRSFGKTTLAIAMCASTVATGGTAVFIDTESSFDIGWANALGLDGDRFFLFQRDGDTLATAEESLQLVRDLLRNNGEFNVDLIVFDSVAAMAPRAMMEGDMDSKSFALRARLLEQFFSIIPGDLKASNATLLMLNQGRIDIASQSKDKTIFPGGLARQHAYSIMVKMLQPERIPVAGQERGVGGWKFRGYTTKNKTAPPGREFEVTLRYDPFVHIDRVSDLYDVATKLALFTNAQGEPYSGRGNVFFQEHNLGNGRNNALASLAENVEASVQIELAVREAFIQLRGQIQRPEAIIEE